MEKNSTCKYYLQIQQEGYRQVQREIKVYNLQIILAIGYRFRNNIRIHFRNFLEMDGLGQDYVIWLRSNRKLLYYKKYL